MEEPSKSEETATPKPAVQAGAEGATEDVTAEVLEVLGLQQGATPDEFRAALGALGERAERATQIESDLAAANAKLAEIEKAKTIAEVDTLLADYEIGDESRDAFREIAATDRPRAAALLAAVPKKKQPAAAPGASPAGLSEPGQPGPGSLTPATAKNPGFKAIRMLPLVRPSLPRIAARLFSGMNCARPAPSSGIAPSA